MFQLGTELWYTWGVAGNDEFSGSPGRREVTQKLYGGRMFGLFSKRLDFETLGLDLIRASAEYQVPTVDGIYRFLEATGQLRLDGEPQEKKAINVAAAAVSGELLSLTSVAIRQSLEPWWMRSTVA